VAGHRVIPVWRGLRLWQLTETILTGGCVRYGSELELEDELELESELESFGVGEFEFEGEEENWIERLRGANRWYEIAKHLFDAGRLGWRAGRWIDKHSKWVFGEPISKELADLMYKHFGRSRRLEDFFDSLPPSVKRWLWRL